MDNMTKEELELKSDTLEQETTLEELQLKLEMTDLLELNLDVLENITSEDGETTIETDEILQAVFGKRIQDHAEFEANYSQQPRSVHKLHLANEFIGECMLNKDEISFDTNGRKDRIGARVVCFKRICFGLCAFSKDRLTISTDNSLCTVQANVGVSKGKWMYEVFLGSKGAMQLGWSTMFCKFNQNWAVGHTDHSYSYDGYRRTKWHVEKERYGENWVQGDIIGCALDLDNGTMDFYRNGHNMGRAFENVSKDMVYFPTVSLYNIQKLTANFGSIPFKYPIMGYPPLQPVPTFDIFRATLLLEWITGIIGLWRLATKSENPKILLEDKTMSVQAFLMCLMNFISKYAAPLLTDSFIVAAVFVPFAQKLSHHVATAATVIADVYELCDHKKDLNICLDLFWAFFERHEIQKFFDALIAYLFSSFRPASQLQQYFNQSKNIYLLAHICQHTLTRHYLLSCVLFDYVQFVSLMHVSPLTDKALADLMGKVWWETCPVNQAIERNKPSYMEACRRINEAVLDVNTYQITLLGNLLADDDATEIDTSREIFVRNFKEYFLKNNSFNAMCKVNSLQMYLPAVLSCFEKLLFVFKILWENQHAKDPYVISRLFYDGSINIPERIGGVLGNLKVMYKRKLLDKLGPCHPVIIEMKEKLLNKSIDNFDRIPTNPDSNIALMDLLDAIIYFYYTIADQQLRKLIELRSNAFEYSRAITSLEARLKLLELSKHRDTETIREQMKYTLDILMTKMRHEGECIAWIDTVINTDTKKMLFGWLLKAITHTFRDARNDDMQHFLPEYYVAVLCGLWFDLRKNMHSILHTETMEVHGTMVNDLAKMLCELFSDLRVTPSMSITLVTAMLIDFMRYRWTMNCLENIPQKTRKEFAESLLIQYVVDDKYCMEYEYIFIRIWYGDGFAFRYDKSPNVTKSFEMKRFPKKGQSKPYPSKTLQNAIRDLFEDAPTLILNFTGSVLGRLNYVFTNFMQIIEDIATLSSKTETVVLNSSQLEACSVNFHSTVWSLRILEMICVISQNIGVQKDVVNNFPLCFNKTFIVGLSQIIACILKWTVSRTGSFQRVMQMRLTDLDHVTFFPILTATIAIFVVLVEMEERVLNSYHNIEEKSSSIQNVSRKLCFPLEDQDYSTIRIAETLLTNLNFELSDLHLVVESQRVQINSQAFSFMNYNRYVTLEEINRVKSMINYLDMCNKKMSKASIIDIHELCGICCDEQIVVKLIPCCHKICLTCINRQLSMKEAMTCFFCKMPTTEVQYIKDGTTFKIEKHDFITIRTLQKS